jgi:hypothetical protein
LAGNLGCRGEPSTVVSSAYETLSPDIQEDTSACLKEGGAELTDSTEVDFEVTRLDDHYFSVVLSRSQYLEGAVHPNNSITTLVFDLSTGQPIPLTEFAEESVLLEYVQAQVTKEGIGTYPSETSNPIEKYCLTEESLVLVDLFSVYAVQAFEVEVPLAEIVDQKI